MNHTKSMRTEQRYIDDLESIVGDMYVRVERNVPYRRKRQQGEIDLIGYREDGLRDYYEVKSTDNPRAIRKAHLQLRKILRCFNNAGDTYIYIGREHELIPYLSNHPPDKDYD